MKHLIVPDPHAKWGPKLNLENRRFDWLGQFIMDEMPDVIVCIGDFADMESLSSYDKGKKCFEGKRWLKDVEATIDAQERMFAPIRKHNAIRKAYKEKQYKPRLIHTLGNHDDERIKRAIELEPMLEGVIDLAALKYQEYWDDVVPYKQSVVVDGILYSHCQPAGVMDRPIGGQHMGHSLLQKCHISTTVGHSHVFDLKHGVRGDGKAMWGLSCGVFREDAPGYAGASVRLWWRGLVVKDHVDDGDYDLKKIRMGVLKDRYS